MQFFIGIVNRLKGFELVPALALADIFTSDKRICHSIVIYDLAILLFVREQQKQLAGIS